MTTTILVWCALICLGVLATTIIKGIENDMEFRRNLKPGDRVTVYVRDDRLQATVKSIDDKEVTVIFDDGTTTITNILLIHKPE